MSGKPRRFLPFTIFMSAAWVLGLTLTALAPGQASALPARLAVRTTPARVAPSRTTRSITSLKTASAMATKARQFTRWRADRIADRKAAEAAAAAAAAPPPAAPVTTTPPPVTGSTPPAGFTACVIRTESGGDSTAYNTSSGASGLFGFLLSTWLSQNVGYPGGASTAPVSVQYEAFDKLYAAAGDSPWAPYDGCTTSSTQAVHAHLMSATVRRAPRRWIAYKWVVNHAKGCWYNYGGTSCAPGFDCSGLVMTAWEHAGIQLPRTTYEMLHSWHLVRISSSQARKGDLAFFGSGHVEMVSYKDRWTIGARDWGLRVESRHNVYFRPTEYFRVR